MKGTKNKRVMIKEKDMKREKVKRDEDGKET